MFFECILSFDPRTTRIISLTISDLVIVSDTCESVSAFYGSGVASQLMIKTIIYMTNTVSTVLKPNFFDSTSLLSLFFIVCTTCK